MKTRIAMTAILLAIASTLAFGQVTSNVADVTLTANMNETLGVSINNNLVDFGAVAPGSAFTGSGPVQITTSWILRGSRTAVNVYAYFTDATDAMNNGLCGVPADCYKIPSSAILGSTDGGATWNLGAFTNAIASGTLVGTGVTVSNTAITNANRNANQVDNLTLQLDLSAGFGQMAAGAYSGVLHIAAVATP